MPSGPLPEGVDAHLDGILLDVGSPALGSVLAVGRSGDVRAAWPLVDLLQIHGIGDSAEVISEALTDLTGYTPPSDVLPWLAFSDLLLAWDVPAPPHYYDYKRRLLLELDTGWGSLLREDADLDWRAVVWGGVFRDGIPALADPPVVPARTADWLPPAERVYGVTVGGETRAYPERVMEVHELVNDTVGGVDVALSYCTLCGAAIAYATGDVGGVPGRLELRTSGLLQRSNKLMYDVQTESLFDQFRGVGVSGPLRGSELERLSVVVTTLAEWREAHPGGFVVAEGAGTGREYRGDVIGDRDADGPIFPVGERDSRLPAQERVFGVALRDGTAVAFPVERARDARSSGREVSLEGVRIELAAGGLRVTEPAASDVVAAHEAYWFAWSQFRPGTLLWGGAD